MAVTINYSNGTTKTVGIPKKNLIAPKKINKGKSKPIVFVGDLNKPGRLRVGHLLHLLSISHSGLYAKIDDGKIPSPDGKDGKRPYWFTETIRPLVTK